VGNTQLNRRSSQTVKGTEGHAASRQRQLENAHRLRDLNLHRGEPGGSTPPAARDRGDETRKDILGRDPVALTRAGKVILTNLEKEREKIKDASTLREILVLKRSGASRLFQLKVRLLSAGKLAARYRVQLSEVRSKRASLVEDLILHELRGRSIKGWMRRPGGSFMPLAGAALKHSLPGVGVPLEALLPFDPTRYRPRYRGVMYRDGVQTDVFLMLPRVPGSSTLELASLRREHLASRIRARKGKLLQWGSVGTHLRIRDGFKGLERYSFQFPGLHQDLVARVLERSYNKGLEAGVFDPAAPLK